MGKKKRREGEEGGGKEKEDSLPTCSLLFLFPISLFFHFLLFLQKRIVTNTNIRIHLLVVGRQKSKENSPSPFFLFPTGSCMRLSDEAIITRPLDVPGLVTFRSYRWIYPWGSQLLSNAGYRSRDNDELGPPPPNSLSIVYLFVYVMKLQRAAC